MLSEGPAHLGGGHRHQLAHDPIEREHERQVANHPRVLAGLDKAIWHAFKTGDFEPSLDVTYFHNRNYQRGKADSTSVLMAASVHGRTDVVDLLLDLGVNVELKSNTGWTAVDYAKAENHIELAAKLEREMPQRNAKGRLIFTADTCTHPKDWLYVDEECYDLICTHCGVILEEHILKLSGVTHDTGTSGEKPAEHQADMELVELLDRLGIDNKAVWDRAMERCIWTKQARAEKWLNDRRRVRQAEARRMLKLHGPDAVPPVQQEYAHYTGKAQTDLARSDTDSVVSDSTSSRAVVETTSANVAGRPADTGVVVERELSAGASSVVAVGAKAVQTHASAPGDDGKHARDCTEGDEEEEEEEDEEEEDEEEVHPEIEWEMEYNS